jgi:hypothetical protein
VCLSLFPLGLPQAHPRATVALIDKLDTDGLGHGDNVDSFVIIYRLLSLEADTFTPAVILNKLNSSYLKRAANSRLIRECNWNFPVNNFGPADSSHPNF